MKKALLMVFSFIICLNFAACAKILNLNTPAKPEQAPKIAEEVIESAPPSSDDKISWNEAYLGVINDLIERYGEGRIEKNSFDDGESMIGVGIVRLIDFDGDGTDELYCAYADESGYWVNKQVIYGYDNGLVVLLEECRVSNPGTDVSPTATFLSKNGKIYLVDIYEMTDGNYYTLQNGKIVSALSYYYDLWEDENHAVNGAAATAEDVQAAIEEMEADGTIEHITFAYDIDPAELIKTKDTIAGLSVLRN